MRSIRFSDPHIGKEGACPRGVDVRAQLVIVLADAKKGRPDWIVLSGDLCSEEPDQEVYDWVKALMDLIGIPWWVTPGNPTLQAPW